MSVKIRIKDFCQSENITISAFEASIGVSNGYVNAISKSIGIDKLNTIIEKYSNLNIEWLLTGRGEMLKTNCISDDSIGATADTATHKDNIKISSRHEIRDLNIDLKPRIPVDAAAGSLSIGSDPISQNGCEMLPVIPRFPKYDFTIVAKGDSMIPEIASGDELACRFISQRNFIQWGRTHVLDTAQGVVVKRIFDRSDSIVCRSTNTNYPDFLIAKEEIYHIALVVGLIRQY